MSVVGLLWVCVDTPVLVAWVFLGEERPVTCFPHGRVEEAPGLPTEAPPAR